ncbi:hypothetical protein F8163_05910 [Bacillus luti]|uniref:TniQ domain-containing protein n=3 Tax=Bacillaceae TaxID=186817 RepID=A0A7V7V6H5_9BACI|nr:hypothetical protein F8163_05910 [Bacillus luti]
MPFESLHSLLYRTLKVNHFPHPSTILKEMSLRLYDNSCNYIDEKKVWYYQLMQMVKMLAYEHDEFVLNKFDKLFIHEELLRRQQEHFIYHFSGSKYCPKCLKENLYHKLHWDIKLVTICTIHKKRLLESCVYCDRKSRISRIMQDECQCGKRFSESLDTKEIHSQMELTIQEEIQSIIFGNKREILIENNDVLTSEEYFRFFVLFCHLVDGLQIEGLFINHSDCNFFNFGRKVKGKKDVLSFNTLTMFVHSIITEPSKYLYLLLKRLDDKEQVPKGITTYKLRLLYKIINDKSGKVYGKIFKSYVTGIGNYGVNRGKYNDVKISKKDSLTCNETVKLYGVPHRRVKFLCERGILIPKTENGIQLIDKRSVEEYVAIMKSSLNIRQTQVLLGTSLEFVKKLVLKGDLKAIYGPHNGWNEWVFLKEDVKRTLNWILSGSVCVDNILDGYIPFTATVHLVKNQGITVMNLIELLITKRIESIVLNSQLNLKGVYIKKSDIDKIIELERQKRINQYGYSLKEVAKILNQDRRKIEKLIHKGEIQAKYVLKNANGSLSYYFDKELINNLIQQNNN